MGGYINKYYKKLRKSLAWNGDYRARPSFLIVGAQKAGTNALHEYLSLHPLIVSAKEKEVHFFDSKLAYSRGAAWYHEQFPPRHSINQLAITFEASPLYLYHEKAASRIHSYSPKIKLMALLRNPIERAYSQWNMYRFLLENASEQWHELTRDTDEPTKKWVDDILARGVLPPFEEDIEKEIAIIDAGDTRPEPSYLRRGLYYEQIKRYLEFFGHDQLLIIESEELKNNTVDTLQKITKFLEVQSHRWYQDDLGPRHVLKYKQPMSDKTRAELEEFYIPHNEKLCQLLGRDLGWR